MCYIVSNCTALHGSLSWTWKVKWNPLVEMWMSIANEYEYVPQSQSQFHTGMQCALPHWKHRFDILPKLPTYLTLNTHVQTHIAHGTPLTTLLVPVCVVLDTKEAQPTSPNIMFTGNNHWYPFIILHVPSWPFESLAILLTGREYCKSSLSVSHSVLEVVDEIVKIWKGRAFRIESVFRVHNVSNYFQLFHL